MSEQDLKSNTNAKYLPTIGLEIHAELKTQTKMFCACRNDADEKAPNTNICPVCMAHPGTLPVINYDAVRKVLSVGVALGATLADYTEFDRKNYFYPDIPKGYQISQYAYPLVRGGSLRGIDITRIHLEEDTARSQHTSTSLSANSGGVSLVDYNRAGLPLMELVTEPVIHNAETAGAFARELQLLLRCLGAGDANMEKGEMRVEANISVAPQGSTLDQDPSRLNLKLGTKVEVKNLNSFRSVERAIAYEIKRQIGVIESGGHVVQETRGWDEAKQSTFPQRKKESSEGYRYFPEPDLPKLIISEIPELAHELLAKNLPELPSARRERYVLLGISNDDAEMYVRSKELGAFFDVFSKQAKNPNSVLLGSNYLTSDVTGMLEKNEMSAEWLTESNAKRFARAIQLVSDGILSSRGAKNTLILMLTDARDPESIAKDGGLIQQSDPKQLTEAVSRVIEANPSVVADYRAGKEASLQFLVGQGMKETKGAANPTLLREEFKKALSY
ncbi:MAG: Asp-tRNA(Asn)/Glu-tRNA(Gln) amidotransferase subunit GatB [bacterium]